MASDRVSPLAVSAVDVGASGSSTFFHFFSNCTRKEEFDVSLSQGCRPGM